MSSTSRHHKKQYIPLEMGLRALLKNKGISDEVIIIPATLIKLLPHSVRNFMFLTRSDGYLSDYCDGYFFKNHQIFGTRPNALQIILYFDELEVCNPLGSHSGVHKLGKSIFHDRACILQGIRNVLLYVGQFTTGVTFYTSIHPTCGMCYYPYFEEVWI